MHRHAQSSLERLYIVHKYSLDTGRNIRFHRTLFQKGITYINRWLIGLLRDILVMQGPGARYLGRYSVAVWNPRLFDKAINESDSQIDIRDFSLFRPNVHYH